MSNSQNEPVADSIEIIDSQTDEHPGQYDLKMIVDHETYYLTIGAGNLDLKVALDAAKRGGVYSPEENDG